MIVGVRILGGVVENAGRVGLNGLGGNLRTRRTPGRQHRPITDTDPSGASPPPCRLFSPHLLPEFHLDLMALVDVDGLQDRLKPRLLLSGFLVVRRTPPCSTDRPSVSRANSRHSRFPKVILSVSIGLMKDGGTVAGALGTFGSSYHRIKPHPDYS